MSGSPLSGSLPAQAAGSSVAGSSRPQALIQRRQRLTDKLRLSTLVILSRPAPQPAPGDSAVALPTTRSFTGTVCTREPSGETAPRHIPCSTSLRALPCVPSGLVMCAGQPEPCPAATSGSSFTIEIGSDFVIGPTLSQTTITGPIDGRQHSRSPSERAGKANKRARRFGSTLGVQAGRLLSHLRG